jgi:hypothetical protein
MTAVDLPETAALLAVSVRTLVVEDGLGFQAAVTPDGSPLIEKVTLPVKPLMGTTATDEVAVALGEMLMLPG